MAAGAIAVAGASGIVSVVGGGRFGEHDGRVLVTAIAAALCGGAALAGLATVEGDHRHPLGWTILVAGPAAFAVLALGIWWDEGWSRHAERLGRGVMTAVVVLAGALIVGALRRSLRLVLPASKVLFWGVVGLVVATTAVTVGAIWVPDLEDVSSQTRAVELLERTLVASYVAIFALFLLVPLVERVLAELTQRRQRVDRGSA